MAIYELGISIDGIPGIYIKYYDFDKKYKGITEYSPTIRQNILNAIAHQFNSVTEKVHPLPMANNLYVYLYSNQFFTQEKRRSSYYSTYLISNEAIHASVSEPMMKTILNRFAEYRPVPNRNCPINNTSLIPFKKTLDGILKDSALKPIERLKQSLFVF